MRNYLLPVILFFLFLQANGQEQNTSEREYETQQQLENLAEQQNGEPEDDSYMQTLNYFKKNKLNLNLVDENELKQLQVISDLQIENFFKYRTLLGNFISIYELQAIPTWDVLTIQKVLPFVRVANVTPILSSLQQRLTKGEHSLLLKYQQVLEKSDGFLRSDSVAIRYPGSPVKALFRYKYNYRNLLQFGITGEKDAGEQFFKGSQKSGFDFYSFHLFVRKLGAVKQLALGDFAVNLGQGLIHWQSLAFKKSTEITEVKRQSDVLRPYNSSGEYNFMRGIGITAGVKALNFTAFASVRKLDGSLNTDTFQTNTDYLSSILNSGYHRTSTEVSKKNAITQTSFGGNISFNRNGFHVGVNGIAFKFSVPLNRNILPYNQYAINGDGWSNYSVDYSYTYRNFHFFGEAATDKNKSKAFLGGLLASLDEKVDVSMVYRNIEKSYQTLYGNAFTESTMPSNEKGLFTGITIRPSGNLKIDAYADVFSFPWLKYRVDAPSAGSEYLLQLSYKPNKQFELYSRFKTESKAINLTGQSLATHQVYQTLKEGWRTQLTYFINREFSYSQRLELLWFNPQDKVRSQQGFLTYAEGKYSPKTKPYSLNCRLQYFETDGFDSRLYAFENDVLYSYSIPQFIGKGLRYYLNFNIDLSKKLTIWARLAQSIYPGQTTIGSGLDKIKGNTKTEVKLQLLYNL